MESKLMAGQVRAQATPLGSCEDLSQPPPRLTATRESGCIEQLSIAMVACDWNGTLVNDAERARQATNHVLVQLGLPELDLAEFRAAFVLPLPHFFTGLGVPVPFLARAERVWNRRLGAAPPLPAPGVHALLASAHSAGVPIGVVSAAAAAVVERDAAALALRDKLTFVVGGAHPKRVALAELARVAGGPVLFVGDTEYDVAEALAAGVTPVGVANGYRPAEALLAAGAPLVVADLVELAVLLEEAIIPASHAEGRGGRERGHRRR